MMKKASLLLLCLLILNTIKSQNDCYTYKTETKTSDIFGRRILDTINTKNGHQIIYSCKKCEIKYIDSLGLVIWTKKINNYSCDLISIMYFDQYFNKKKGDIPRKRFRILKKYEIIFQINKSHELYAIKLSNGKIKKLRSDFFIK